MNSRLFATKVISMFMFLTFVLSFYTPNRAIAQKKTQARGTATGGGGTFAEQEFAKSAWIKFYRIKRAKLNNVNLKLSQEDLEKLEKLIIGTKVIETDKILTQRGQRKNALNFADGTVPCEFLYCGDPKQKFENFEQPVILFQANAWRTKSGLEKIDFAYHEYKGLVSEDRNNYELTARLAAAELAEKDIFTATENEIKNEATEETTQIFLERASNYLDEINSLIRVALYGEALQKAEVLRAQILTKLGVNPMTGKRVANIKIELDDSTFEYIGSSRCVNRELSHRYKGPSNVVDLLRDPTFLPLFELIQFQKLLALAYSEAYTKKTGSISHMPYLNWVQSFKVLVQATNQDKNKFLWVTQQSVYNSDYYNYVNLEFYKKLTYVRYSDNCDDSGGPYEGHSNHR